MTDALLLDTFLESSSVPVAQIAEETGFQSLSYFSKFFHDRTGLSPSQFRRARLPSTNA